MAGSFENWTVQARKGILEMAVLTALAGGERYGYELVKSLVAVPGLTVTEGTLYPLLSRLRQLGWIESRLVESNEGPARKYYVLTSDGREALDLMETYFAGVTGALEKLQADSLQPKRKRKKA
ncbi:PadR family transcriptional regulator [Verrucomicrobiales bacterium]|nr:PadR family transcriptional regulator [Verrucomicrobiales bacterium]